MKYDITLDMNNNDSHTIILKQIKKGANVLEFGSANGKMTQYMKEILRCNVYIVEKDPYSFKCASQYAKDAICGDILEFEWLKWKNILFDYILFADVLEHISNPKEILQKTEQLLQDKGTVIISIPNITHNDIIIKAFHERFDYTDVGLLDNTHLRFWGYKNIFEFIEGTSYKVNNIDYTIWNTGTTEQKMNLLTGGDKELIDILQERKYGNVYQFIFSLNKVSKKICNRTKKDLENNEVCKVYFSTNNDFKEEFGKSESPISHEFKRYKYNFNMNIPDGVKKILIKPAIGKRCILDNLQIRLSKDINYICIYSQNINFANTYCLIDEEPFIVIELGEKSKNLSFRYCADVILQGYEFIDYICKGCALKMANEKELIDKLNQLSDLIEILDKKTDTQNENLFHIIANMKEENHEMKEQIQEFEVMKEKIHDIIKKNDVVIREINKLTKNNEFVHMKLDKRIKNENYMESKLLDIENNNKNYIKDINNRINNLDWRINQNHQNIINIERKTSIILDKLANKVKKGIVHFGNKDDALLIANSYFFDWKWYINKYNLRFNNEISTAKHYLNIGWKLYYDPSIYFSTVAYLVENWDVKTADINPLLHYEKFGKEEHRNIGNTEGIKEEYNLIKKSVFFDEEWYRNKYQVDKNADAIYYFLFHGLGEYHNPSLRFSSLDYLMDNIYQIGEVQNPLVHYERNKKANKKLVIKEVKEDAINELHDVTCEIVDESARSELEKYTRKQIEIHEKSVDIIICVYNAYEDVKKCIESVIENTTKPYRIILVDDNSAELTASYLSDVSKKYRNIKLIRNDSDLHGYTYAANIGLKNSTADYCIMLNSDTIVSEHWLDNMIACAESDDKIGIVGPLSNTASWQSVPKLIDDDGDWCHNIIPENFTISDVAKMIERNSGRIYPKVPLLNGFCLMIKRDVINEIGYFDEENFGRGFAEEDDYNTRAIKSGFLLAIADDTYIFHAQSKSYTDEKRLALCKLSGESLRKKHGKEYIDNCSSFMATNIVLDSIRKRVEIMFEKESIYRRCEKTYSGKKILFLLPGSSASGGANVIIQESNALVRMGIEVTILNLENNREEFNKAYKNITIPVIWIKDYTEFNYSIAKDYDVVVCTLFRTVEYCKFLEQYHKPIMAYYIQDYEPYFIQEEIKNGDYDHIEYERAKKSYTLIPNCINVTKTRWNRDEVKKHTGAECFILGPSLNTELFMPRLSIKNVKVVITAMIRPNTKRRGPQMTFDVLRKLKIEFGDKVSIRIFGADPKHDLYSKLFFAKQKKDFKYINYGLTSPELTARILAESDIFLDLSEFQAMGLTAMEAMACGCATIVPKNGGTDCFAKDQINSLVIDTLNFEECLNHAKRLVIDRNLREKLGQQAYKDMAELYPEKVAERFLDVIFCNDLS